MPRGRFNYSRFRGFSGYGGEMGNPASSTGGAALSRMTQQSAPRTPPADPLWQDIEGTFQDILGEYANMDLDMPIKPPDMSDPQDQMRYLKDLEALGMSSAPSASLMRGNMDLGSALQLVKFQHQMEKENTDMMMKLLPMLGDNKELQSTMAAQLMNKVMGGQKVDVQDQSTFGILKDPGVTQLTPENATEGQLYQGIASMALPKAAALAGDKAALKDYLDEVFEQLVKGQVNESIAVAIVNKIHADALGQAKAGEPTY